MQAGIVLITGLKIDTVFLFFPLITLILGVFTWYLLGTRLFRTKKWGLITALFFLTLSFTTLLKGANFAYFFLALLFFYFWIKYEQEGLFKDAIFSGISLGLIGLVYGGIFVAIVAIFCLGILYYLISNIVRLRNEKNFFQIIWEFIKKYYVIFLIALIISLIFFLPLIVKYRLNEVNGVTK
ncbi:MAG: hypothetical protein QXG00_03470 [Candidatus Woesearchaeota archaeon]